MGPPLEPLCDARPLLVTERSRLLEALSGLDATDWERPTPCPGWTVRDLVSHLVGDDLSLLSRHRDGHHGTRPPDRADEERFDAWIDALQDEWVRAARRLSPAVLTELLAWALPRLVDTFAQADLTSPTSQVSWASDQPVARWFDLVRELSEYWIHRQQLLEALGRPSDLRADLARPVLDGLRWAFACRLDAVARPAGATIAIEVAGPIASRWALISNGTSWRFEDDTDEAAIASLVLSTEQAWRLLTNDLSHAEQASLERHGDAAVLDALLHARAVLGTPS